MKKLLIVLLTPFLILSAAAEVENIKVTFQDESGEASFMLESDVEDTNSLDFFDLPSNDGTLPQKKMTVRAASDENKEPAVEWIINTQYGFARVINNFSQAPNSGDATEVDLGEGEVESIRVYISAIIKKKHEIRLLFAPLSYENTFISNEEILYNGVNFLAGQRTETGYQFNSYRLSYIYHFDQTGRVNYRIGFSAKIRDAYTYIRQDGRSTQFNDLGFVPLLHLGVRIKLTDKLYWDNEVEGSWAPQGYAIDFRSSLHYAITERFGVNVGVGYLSGGADVESINTFADILFGFVGVTIRF